MGGACGRSRGRGLAAVAGTSGGQPAPGTGGPSWSTRPSPDSPAHRPASSLPHKQETRPWNRLEQGLPSGTHHGQGALRAALGLAEGPGEPGGPHLGLEPPRAGPPRARGAAGGCGPD